MLGAPLLYPDVPGLFFTMMLYLLLVIWVLVVQAQTKARWTELEDQTRRFLREQGLGFKGSGPNPPIKTNNASVWAPWHCTSELHLASN